jgi:tRNA pseudouridine55 synthase
VTVTRDESAQSVLLIRKSAGMTSFDVIAVLRKILEQKRIGHAGTLDRAAEGLLVVCAGRATRLVRYLIEKDKRYTGFVKLGITTDSCDREGTVTGTNPTAGITESMIREAVASFRGSILQTPPEYSAIKIAGRRASDIARRGGAVEMKERPVEIYAIETVAVDMDAAAVTIDVKCSKGTYIRALARDIGRRLGCGAYLEGLTRTESGDFLLKDAVTPGELADAIGSGSSMRKFCIPPGDVIREFPRLSLDEAGSERVRHGAFFLRENIIEGSVDSPGVYAIADPLENLIAIAEIEIDDWLVKYRNVFNN